MDEEHNINNKTNKLAISRIFLSTDLNSKKKLPEHLHQSLRRLFVQKNMLQ